MIVNIAKKLLRFLACFFVILLSLFLVGFDDVVSKTMETEAMCIILLFGTTLILSTILFLIWESHLYHKRMIEEVIEWVEALQKENRKNNE